MILIFGLPRSPATYMNKGYRQLLLNPIQNRFIKNTNSVLWITTQSQCHHFIRSSSGDGNSSSIPHCSFPKYSIFAPSRDITTVSMLSRQSTRTMCSASSPANNDNDINNEYRRNKSIRMNPKGIGKDILPGYVTEKIDKRTGERRLINVDRMFGFFWMIKDLRVTDGKPILSNTNLIPVEGADPFPPLRAVSTLSGKPVDLPDFFIRGADAVTSCTLLVISYKDYGYKLLSSWTDPFERAFILDENKKKDDDNSSSSSNVSIVRLAITEGGMLIKMLKGLIANGMKKNVPKEEHDSFLVHFGDSEDFRDALRMHNTMTGYAVLLDGFGRVRWMGSGKASEDDLSCLIGCTEKLLKFDDQTDETKVSSSGRVGKKILKNKR